VLDDEGPARGAPVSVVEVVHPAWEATSLRRRTDGTGRVLLDAVPAGRWTVSTGWSFGGRVVTVTAAQHSHVELQIDPDYCPQVMTANPGRFQLASVRPFSPAWEAGLRPGFELVDVAGVDSMDLANWLQVTLALHPTRDRPVEVWADRGDGSVLHAVFGCASD